MIWIVAGIFTIRRCARVKASKTATAKLTRVPLGVLFRQGPITGDQRS